MQVSRPFVSVGLIWMVLGAFSPEAQSGTTQLLFQLPMPGEGRAPKKQDKSLSDSKSQESRPDRRVGPRGVTFTVPGGSAMELLQEEHIAPSRIVRERERTSISSRSEEGFAPRNKIKRQRLLDPGIPQPQVGPFHLSPNHDPARRSSEVGPAGR